MEIVYRLAPSVLAADFGHLADHIRAVEQSADLLHVDVMDGHFVPPISIGPVVVRSLRKITALPLECHLMVDQPEHQIEQFAEAGGDSVLWHLEAARDPAPLLERARGLGLRTGIAINPETPFAETILHLESVDVLNVMTVNPGWAGQAFLEGMLPKIREAREYITSRGLRTDISVDGGINVTTGRACLDAGANVLGAATAIFGQPDPGAAAGALKDLLRERARQAV